MEEERNGKVGKDVGVYENFIAEHPQMEMKQARALDGCRPKDKFDIGLLTLAK